jgi:hypothetical protein
MDGAARIKGWLCYNALGCMAQIKPLFWFIFLGLLFYIG